MWLALDLVIFLSLLEHSQAQTPTPTLTITPTSTLHHVPETLWGVFFEDINHAEEGGLYSELISNRNFGGSDYAPWTPLGGALIDLDSSYPLNLYNSKSLHVLTTMTGVAAGVSNPGFWGIPIKAHTSYTLSFYAIASMQTTLEVTVGNAGKNGATYIYWTQQVSLPAVNITPDEVLLSPLDVAAAPWIKSTYTFTVNMTDSASMLYIMMPNATLGQELWLDCVSLQPTQGWRGLSFLRADLAERIDALKPAFMRFPGGGVVEGDRLRDRFDWKRTLGPVETRPGHYDMWHYWSEDGLGLYEFLLMLEVMSSRPIWVVNSGNSRDEQIDTQNIYPWIQDALESLEFAMGDPQNTKWGKKRAQLGHPAPFNIYALGIGNENCEQSFYTTNYGAFYAALSVAYPNLRLIANCDLTSAQPPQPVQLWDYHAYNNPQWFIDRQHEFDTYPRGDGSKRIFVSEYAVSSVEAGNGNLIAAIAEATWMIMMERNSDLVDLASYAPLFVNNNDRTWNPDAIVFNSSTSYGTPSYWLQYMFSRAQDGTHNQFLVNAGWTYASGSNLTQSSTIASVVSGSSSSSSSSSTHLVIIKLVNWASVPRKLLIEIPTSSSFTVPSPIVEWRSLTSAKPTDENSLDQPGKIIPKDATLTISLSVPDSVYMVPVTLPAYSIHILRVQLNITQ